MVVIINFLIAAVLAFVAIIDWRKHIIPNEAIGALLLLGAIKSYLNSGLLNLLANAASCFLIFLVCFLVGAWYWSKKKIDLAGGGDYKLIAAFALIYGLGGLWICLMAELVYEFIYRYVLFPKNKRKALPLGTSFGVFGIILQISEF
jgi:Flp pilus assembly protein protease CpaA